MDFIQYLTDWHDKASDLDFKFMSASTYQGFQVTLKTIIEVMIFLTEECGFDYLMTARVNQDMLEVTTFVNSKDTPLF